MNQLPFNNLALVKKNGYTYILHADARGVTSFFSKKNLTPQTPTKTECLHSSAAAHAIWYLWLWLLPSFFSTCHFRPRLACMRHNYFCCHMLTKVITSVLIFKYLMINLVITCARDKSKYYWAYWWSKF